MGKEKLLNIIKEDLITIHNKSKYKLEKVVPYYLLIRNGTHEIFNELFELCNQQDFYVNYNYDPEDYYTFGNLSIHFVPIGAEDNSYITRKRDETYFEIDLLWFEHGSTDEYYPRVVIRKCKESKFIDYKGNSDMEFEKWYSELTDLQQQEKKDRLKRINDEIKKLEKEKKKLEK